MSLSALVAEPSLPVAGALKKYLEGAGFGVRLARSMGEALQLFQQSAPDILFCSSSDIFDGEQLCARVKQGAPLCPVVLLYPPDVDDPDREAARAGADAYMVGPLKRATVVSCAKTMLRIRTLVEQVERLETDLKRQVADQREDPSAAEPLIAADFEFFKRFLLMEVKRSRRYRYPVAFLLVGMDRFDELTGAFSEEQRSQVGNEALSVITRSLRDIDLAVASGESRYLVFLPHTPRDGALTVASRVREKLTGMEGLPESTASVGVASYEPGPEEKEVSFGSLLKDATEALQRAQVAGGDRVEAAGEKVKRDRISMG